MNKSLLLFVIMIMIYLLNVSCKDTPEDSIEDYILSNVPSKIYVEIPESLKESDEDISKITTVVTPDSTSGGYTDLRDMSTDMLVNIKEIALELLIIDAYFPSAVEYLNKNAATEIPEKTLSVEYTEEMANKALDIILASYPKGSKQTLKQKIKDEEMEMVGETITNPKIISTNINTPDTLDADGDGYNFKIVYADMDILGINYSEEDDFETTDKETTILWNTDKNKVSVTRSFTINYKDFVMSAKLTIIYDGTTAAPVMFYTFKGGVGNKSYSASCKIQQGGSNDLVKIHSYQFKREYSSKTNIIGSNYIIDAVADNDGGFIQYKYWNSANQNVNYKYRELFNGKGKLLGQSEYDSISKNYKVIEGSNPGYGYNGITDFAVDTAKLKINGITATTTFVIVNGSAVYNPLNLSAFFDEFIGSGGYNAADTSQNFIDFYGFPEQLKTAKLYKTLSATSFELITGAYISE